MNKIFIVGGGNSLKGFDFSILEKEKTIVVNDAIFDVSNPDVFITMDYYFISKMDCQKYNEFRKIGTNKIYVKKPKDEYDEATKFREFDLIINSTQEKHFSYNFKNFAHGKNSGFCALQYAIILGYKEIYLLGIDLCLNNGESHYHGNTNIQNYDELLLKYFENFYLSIRELKKNIKIYSCSEISKLNKFLDFKNINEVLK